MLALDALLSLIASGRMRLPSAQTAATQILAICLGLILFNPSSAHAQDKDYRDALSLHLAYVITGNDRVDRMSEAGLNGLVKELNRRTTIEPTGVRGVNLETDQLDYYPFLYWPIARDIAPLSDKASTALNTYMASGGTIVMDLSLIHI